MKPSISFNVFSISVRFPILPRLDRVASLTDWAKGLKEKKKREIDTKFMQNFNMQHTLVNCE